MFLSYYWDLLFISDQPNFNEPFDGTLLTPIMSPLGTIISLRLLLMICLLAKVMSSDLMAFLLDPSLFRVSFYDLILCTVLLLWHSQRFEGAELCICRSQIFLKLKMSTCNSSV